jgi:beta-xylosidase
LWKNDGNSRGQPTFIYAQKLSPDGLKLVGGMKQLIRNDEAWEGNLVEGPAIMKHGDYFYLFYAGNGCCGKNCSYGTGVARSKSLLGPYEKFSGNPILFHNDSWRCPGHGTLVNTPDGRTFFLCHAYATKGFQFIGRQGVLDEVKWNADGWPSINDGKGISTTAHSPFNKTQRVNLEFDDDFLSTNLDLRWQWPHTLQPKFEIKNGELILNSQNSRGNDLFGSTVAAQTMTADYAATTVIDCSGMKPETQAGLFAFGDLGNALGITLGGGKISVRRVQRSNTETLSSVAAPDAQKIYLRIEAKDGHQFRFLFWNGTDWKNVGEDQSLEGDYLPPWDRGVRVALTVGGSENAFAKFDWIRLVPK